MNDALGAMGLVFLDFDGVLHPQYEGQFVPPEMAFCHLQKFEAVLRDFPCVDIVISSSWREQFNLEQLKAHFSPDIAARVIGVTPVLKPADRPHDLALREQEVTMWLTQHGRLQEPWLALDDATWQFKRLQKNLVSCQSHVGLDKEAVHRLRSALLAFDQQE